MNPKKMLIWAVIALLMVFLIMFGTLFIVSLIILIQEAYIDTSTIMMVVLNGGLACACVLLLRVLIMKVRTKPNKSVSQFKRDMKLRYDAVCPNCDSRLSVCEKNSNTNIIRLNTVKLNVVNDYYCPSCKTRFDISSNYGRFTPAERELPQQTGIRHGVNMKAKALWMIFAMLPIALGVLFAFTVLAYMQDQYGYIPVVSGIVMTIPLLAFVYLAVLFFKKWRQLLVLYYELIENGLIINDRSGRHYYAWEDFRIVSYIPKYMNQQDIYIFDLNQRVFTLDSGIEDYRQLADKIVAQIRPTAILDISD